MAKMSAKRRKTIAETSGEREAYRKGVLFCQICAKRRAAHVHEITRGSHREAALRVRAAWLAVCPPCHDELDDYSRWPVSRQLAAKLLADPLAFDLAKINELRGRDEGAIDLADVAKWLDLRTPCSK